MKMTIWTDDEMEELLEANRREAWILAEDILQDLLAKLKERISDFK